MVNIPSSESETAQLVNTFLMSLSKRFQKESTRFLSCTGNLANSCSGASHRKSQHCMHCFWQCTCTAHAAWAYIGIECEEVVIPSYAVVCQFLKFFSRCHDCWHRQMEGCHMTHTHTPSVTLQHCQHSSLQLYPSTLHPHYTPAPLNPHSTPAPLNPQSTQAPFTPLYSSTSHPHSTPAPLNPHSTQAPLTPLYPSTPQPSLYPSTPQPSLYPSTPHPTLPSTPHPLAPPVAFGTS